MARLSPDQLEELQLEGKPMTIIDVRKPESYKAGHVPGAINIPVAKIKNDPPALPKDQLLVTYCGGGTSGVTAAKALKEYGYDVEVMEGFRAWEAAGKTVVVSEE